jgi:hypothetical protein
VGPKFVQANGATGLDETQMNIAVNLVLIALAVFVAWGRLGPYSFTP